MSDKEKSEATVTEHNKKEKIDCTMIFHAFNNIFPISMARLTYEIFPFILPRSSPFCVFLYKTNY